MIDQSPTANGVSQGPVAYAACRVPKLLQQSNLG